jgi:hypothetical protein
MFLVINCLMHGGGKYYLHFPTKMLSATFHFLIIYKILRIEDVYENVVLVLAILMEHWCMQTRA